VKKDSDDLDLDMIRRKVKEVTELLDKTMHTDEIEDSMDKPDMDEDRAPADESDKSSGVRTPRISLVIAKLKRKKK